MWRHSIQARDQSVHLCQKADCLPKNKTKTNKIKKTRLVHIDLTPNSNNVQKKIMELSSLKSFVIIMNCTQWLQTLEPYGQYYKKQTSKYMNTRHGTLKRTNLTQEETVRLCIRTSESLVHRVLHPTSTHLIKSLLQVYNKLIVKSIKRHRNI